MTEDGWIGMIVQFVRVMIGSVVVVGILVLALLLLSLLFGAGGGSDCGIPGPTSYC